MKLDKIGVMCGSSSVCPKKYLNLSYKLGKILGNDNRRLIYGGGAKGLMNEVANGALEAGGEVYGYMPEFMIKVEWQHQNLTKLITTKDMSERKHLMMSTSNATIFLPGGCGTMEEFFDWLSCKRLGKYNGPLIIVNFEGYYDPLIKLLNNMEKERFHNPIHSQMWIECDQIEQILDIIDQAPAWIQNPIEQASAK